MGTFTYSDEIASIIYNMNRKREKKRASISIVSILSILRQAASVAFFMTSAVITIIGLACLPVTHIMRYPWELFVLKRNTQTRPWILKNTGRLQKKLNANHTKLDAGS